MAAIARSIRSRWRRKSNHPSRAPTSNASTTAPNVSVANGLENGACTGFSPGYTATASCPDTQPTQLDMAATDEHMHPTHLSFSSSSLPRDVFRERSASRGSQAESVASSSVADKLLGRTQRSRWREKSNRSPPTSPRQHLRRRSLSCPTTATNGSVCSTLDVLGERSKKRWMSGNKSPKKTNPGDAFRKCSDSSTTTSTNTTSCSKTPVLAEKAAKMVPPKSLASDVVRERSASCGSVSTSAHAQRRADVKAYTYRSLRNLRVRIQEQDCFQPAPFDIRSGYLSLKYLTLTDCEPLGLESGSPALDHASTKSRDSLDFPNCRLKKGLSEIDHEKALAWYAACEVEPLDGRYSPDTAYWIMDPYNEDPGYGV